MKTGCFMVLVMSSCVFGVAPESVLGKVGESVTLHTNVTKQQYDTILWYFKGTRIAQINGDASKSCLYDGKGGIFRGRLEVDYESGSLNITNITAEHTGQYEADIIWSKSAGTRESLNRASKCDSNKVTQKINNLGNITKTLFVSISGPKKPNEFTKERPEDSDKSAIAGISVAVLLLLVVCGLMYCHRQKAKRVKELCRKSKQEGLQRSHRQLKKKSNI